LGLTCDNNGGVSLEAEAEGFQENYELHSGPLAKYPKSHPEFTSKAKIWTYKFKKLRLREGLQQMFY